MAGWQEFTGLNRGYVLELYEKYPPGPCVGRRGNACALRALDPSAGAGARRSGDPVPDDRRRRQPRAVDPALRPPGGEARSARPPHPCRRSVAAPGDERRHRGRPPPPAREPDYRRRSATPPRTCWRWLTPSGASTARRPATTTRTCSCRKNGTGSATRPKAAGSARPRIRSIPSRCSSGSRRSRRSNAFCNGCFPARPASRSKGSTCSCRSSTK